MQEGLINSAGSRGCLFLRGGRGDLLDILNLCIGSGEQCGESRVAAGHTVRSVIYSITISPGSLTAAYEDCPGVLLG